MNAYTHPSPATSHEPSETAAQHMRMLHRLAELGMGLAEAAAADARSAPPEPEPEPEPAPPAQSAPRTPTRAEHILAFTRASRIVAQAIALHAALEAGPKPAAARQAATQAPPREDPRRKFLQEALTEVAQLNPHLEISQPEAHQLLESRLADTGHDYDSLATLLGLVTADLGLPPEAQPTPATRNFFRHLEETDPPEPPD